MGQGNAGPLLRPSVSAGPQLSSSPNTAPNIKGTGTSEALKMKAAAAMRAKLKKQQVCIHVYMSAMYMYVCSHDIKLVALFSIPPPLLAD